MKTRAAIALEAAKPLVIEEVDLEGPKAGFFCAVASLRPVADAQASPCGARLATTQNNPGQTIPAGRIVL